MNKPVVAIVGRPNVGKSALFNRMTGKKIALVYDRPGVTRDRMRYELKWDGKVFSVIDTGGIGLEDESGFEQAIQKEVDIAMEMAEVILLVVDGRAGLTHVDEDVALRLRRTKKRVVVVVNKLDSRVQAGWDADFMGMGFDEVYPISAAHGVGMEELMDAVTEGFSRIPEEPDEEDAEEGDGGEEDEGEGEGDKADKGNKGEKNGKGGKGGKEERLLRVALVGRPNVGKSSTINALLNESRVIVSPIAGTTRDAVDVEFEYKGETICLVDTAGMRRRTRLKDPLEQEMTGRTAHSINRADICVLVIDAEHGIEAQDKKIAGLIQEAAKPCLVLINKWDLVKKAKAQVKEGDPLKDISMSQFKKEYEEAAREAMFFFPHVPVVFVSAEERRNLGEFLKLLMQVNENRLRVLNTGVLNRVMARALETHPPKLDKRRKQRLKIFYISQQKDDLVRPTVTAFVNHKDLWTEDYQRFLESHVRKEFKLGGCPLKWVVKSRRESKDQKR